jgi:hypothetical protein
VKVNQFSDEMNWYALPTTVVLLNCCALPTVLVLLFSFNRFIILASEWNPFWFLPSVRLLLSRELVELGEQGLASAFGSILKRHSNRRCRTIHILRFFAQT